MKVLPVMGMVLVSFLVIGVNNIDFKHLLLKKSRDKERGRKREIHSKRG